MTPERFELGDRVRFAHWLVRRRHAAPDAPTQDVKAWERMPPAGMGWPRLPMREGIVVGRRTLVNGRSEWGGYDEPARFVPEQRFTAYLVAVDLHQRPLFVLPDDLHRVVERVPPLDVVLAGAPLDADPACYERSTPITGGDPSGVPARAALNIPRLT